MPTSIMPVPAHISILEELLANAKRHYASPDILSILSAWPHSGLRGNRKDNT